MANYATLKRDFKESDTSAAKDMAWYVDYGDGAGYTLFGTDSLADTLTSLVGLGYVFSGIYEDEFGKVLVLYND